MVFPEACSGLACSIESITFLICDREFTFPYHWGAKTFVTKSHYQCLIQLRHHPANQVSISPNWAPTRSPVWIYVHPVVLGNSLSLHNAGLAAHMFGCPPSQVSPSCVDILSTLAIPSSFRRTITSIVQVSLVCCHMLAQQQRPIIAGG